MGIDPERNSIDSAIFSGTLDVSGLEIVLEEGIVRTSELRKEAIFLKERRIIMKIYVGNLSYDTTEEELRGKFVAYGDVESVVIPTDRYGGRSRGFAFIEMPTVLEGQAAISGLNGTTLRDRSLKFDAASARTEGRGGGSYKDRTSGGIGGGGRWRRY